MSTEVQTNWIIFSFDGIWMAMEQQSIRSFSESANLTFDEESSSWLTPEDWHAWKLDRFLEPDKGDMRRFVIFIEALHNPVGLMCDEIQILPTQTAQSVLPLPDVIAQDKGIAMGFIRLSGNKIATVLEPIGLSIKLAELRNRLTTGQTVT